MDALKLKQYIRKFDDILSCLGLDGKDIEGSMKSYEDDTSLISISFIHGLWTFKIGIFQFDGDDGSFPDHRDISEILPCDTVNKDSLYIGLQEKIYMGRYYRGRFEATSQPIDFIKLLKDLGPKKCSTGSIPMFWPYFEYGQDDKAISLWEKRTGMTYTPIIDVLTHPQLARSCDIYLRSIYVPYDFLPYIRIDSTEDEKILVFIPPQDKQICKELGDKHSDIIGFKTAMDEGKSGRLMVKPRQHVTWCSI